MMENSDIDDDFTLDGNALHRNKKEKDLRKKEDLLAVLVIMVRVAMRLDDDDAAVVVVVLVAIVLAPANIIRVCLEVTSMQNVCKVSISPLITHEHNAGTEDIRIHKCCFLFPHS
jgi:hypothetical protein